MIEVHDLSYTYPGTGAPALHGLSFRIEPGEIFGFLGPSGAGKSTTQKILIGLLRGYQGRVSLLGKDLATWRSDYYEHIGVAFELPNHFSKLSGLENLAYFAALYRRPARPALELLDQVGLADDAHLPVGQYSKGMKNRLSVARALLHDPDLLFLDEPTSGLDPVNARRIKELIATQQEAGKTIFLTTHNMVLADELCNRVAFIVDGAIQLIDTPRDLRLRYGEATVRVEYRCNGRVAQQDFALAGLGKNRGFTDLLRTGTVQTIHSREATLDDIFVRVTGRGLT